MGHARTSWNSLKFLDFGALTGKELLTSFRRSLPRETSNNTGIVNNNNIVT